MDKFELNHAVTLFTQQTTTINSLWTVYVAATFAAAGYGFTRLALTARHCCRSDGWLLGICIRKLEAVETRA